MKPDLIARLIQAGLGQPAFIQTKPKMEHTKNVFGPISEVEGKRLRLIERALNGDCLCVFNGSKGEGLVDVDHRDIDEPKT